MRFEQRQEERERAVAEIEKREEKGTEVESMKKKEETQPCKGGGHVRNRGKEKKNHMKENEKN